MTVVLSAKQTLYQVAALDITYLVCLEAQNLTETPGYIRMLNHKTLTQYKAYVSKMLINKKKIELQRIGYWTCEKKIIKNFHHNPENYYNLVFKLCSEKLKWKQRTLTVIVKLLYHSYVA